MLKIKSSLKKVHFVWYSVSWAMQVAASLNLGHFLSHKSNFIENLPNFPHTKETCYKKKKYFSPTSNSPFFDISHWNLHPGLHQYPLSYFPSINVTHLLHIKIKAPFPQSRNWYGGAKKRDVSFCNGYCALPPRNTGNTTMLRLLLHHSSASKRFAASVHTVSQRICHAMIQKETLHIVRSLCNIQSQKRGHWPSSCQQRLSKRDSHFIYQQSHSMGIICFH